MILQYRSLGLPHPNPEVAAVATVGREFQRPRFALALGARAGVIPLSLCGLTLSCMCYFGDRTTIEWLATRRATQIA